MFSVAARDHNVAVAGFDHLGRHVDAVQAGATDHVDGDSRVVTGRPALMLA